MKTDTVVEWTHYLHLCHSGNSEYIRLNFCVTLSDQTNTTQNNIQNKPSLALDTTSKAYEHYYKNAINLLITVYETSWTSYGSIWTFLWNPVNIFYESLWSFLWNFINLLWKPMNSLMKTNEIAYGIPWPCSECLYTFLWKSMDILMEVNGSYGRLCTFWTPIDLVLKVYEPAYESLFFLKAYVPLYKSLQILWHIMNLLMKAHWFSYVSIWTYESP